jgi:ATP-binding protein involved in chromosome partitioning
MSAPAPTLESAIQAALAAVQDPEIRRPITELGMVKSIDVAADGTATIGILLTVAGCPLRDKLTSDITAAVSAVAGVSRVAVDFGVMSPEQRQELQRSLRGGATPEPVIPFAQPGSRTRVYAVASGKGGVGKSSVTVNLAAALAARGLAVGVVDATSTATRCPACSAPRPGRPRSKT